MFALVLGGGGSRGALQVGALRALFEADIVPDMVVGTSVGALNGSIVAHNPTLAGVDELEAIWHTVHQQDVFPGNGFRVLSNLLRRREGLYENSHWLMRMRTELPVERFSELPIPFYAVATDIETGNAFVFGDDLEDTLLDGLMASTAVSPLHPSWHVGDQRFIDGAFVANLPVLQAVERGATEIIALNLNGRFTPSSQLNNPVAMVNHTIDIMLKHQIATQTAAVQAQPHIRLHKIDLLVEEYLSIIDFEQSERLIAYGYDVMKKTLVNDLADWFIKNRQSTSPLLIDDLVPMIAMAG